MDFKRNKKYREICESFGLDVSCGMEYLDKYILSTPIKNVYILLDENFNIFSIDEFDDLFDFEAFIEFEYFRYVDSRIKLPSPFKNYSIKDFNDLVEEFSIAYTSDNSYVLVSNFDNSILDSKYYDLYEYALFLRREIINFYYKKFMLLLKGITTYNPKNHLKNVLTVINLKGKELINEGKRPLLNIDYVSDELYSISNILMKQYDVEFSNNNIVAINGSNLSIYLDELSDELLDIKNEYKKNRMLIK